MMVTRTYFSFGEIQDIELLQNKYMYTYFKPANFPNTFSHLDQDRRARNYGLLAKAEFSQFLRRKFSVPLWANIVFCRISASIAIVRYAAMHSNRFRTRCARHTYEHTAITTDRAICYKITGQPRFRSRRSITIWTMLLLVQVAWDKIKKYGKIMD